MSELQISMEYNRIPLHGNVVIHARCHEFMLKHFKTYLQFGILVAVSDVEFRDRGKRVKPG
jgi:hypothetical protein